MDTPPSEDDLNGPQSIGVTMLLADSAQVADGKLFILGGGLSTIGPRPQPIAIALRLLIPWDRANISHSWLIEMLDEDGQPVPGGDRPFKIGGNLVAGRPAGARPGTPLALPLAINLGPIKLPPAKRYTFQLSIAGESRPDWRVWFDTRKAPTPKPETKPPAQQ